MENKKYIFLCFIKKNKNDAYIFKKIKNLNVFFSNRHLKKTEKKKKEFIKWEKQNKLD